jgi:predicted nucleic acid-binding protein
LILVDTSVWIDFFRGTESPHAYRLEQGIRDRENLALCGIVLTETLQGIRDDNQYLLVKQSLRPLILLPMDERVFILAAELYRQLRKQGLTIRKTNDCIIAATAIRHGVPLLNNDKDFESLSRHSPLETVRT